jgi:hypothetical protein
VIGTQAPTLELRYHRLERLSRWLAGIAVVAIAVLATLLAWTVSQQSTAVTEARGVADQLALAWTKHDPNLAADMYAADVTWVDIKGYSSTGLPAVREGISLSQHIKLAVTVTGDPLVDGNRVVVPVTFSYVAGTPAVPYPVERPGVVQLELNDAGLVTSQRDLPLAAPPIADEVASSVFAAWSGHQEGPAAAIYAQDAVMVDSQGYRATGVGQIGEAIRMGSYVGYDLKDAGPMWAVDNIVYAPATETYVAIREGDTIATTYTTQLLIRLELNAQGLIVRQENFVLNAEPAS